MLVGMLSPNWDHPRVCGKNRCLIIADLVLLGSPPRVREKLYLQLYLLHFLVDHPRVCGKNEDIKEDFENKLGSPPRVREKRFFQNHFVKSCGITPACAGKT